MTTTYTPNYSNAVIVLTAGRGRAGRHEHEHAADQAGKLYNSSRKVEIVVLMFGTAGDFTSLQQHRHGYRRRGVQGH